MSTNGHNSSWMDGLTPEEIAKVRQAFAAGDVIDTLQYMLESEDLNIHDLGIAFGGGVVVLSGIAMTQQDKDRAASIVARHPDVQSIVNDIEVEN